MVKDEKYLIDLIHYLVKFPKETEWLEFKTNYWSAIPGGIPPFLINGICIKRNKYSDEELDELSKLYPNAVIFNSRKEVVRYPYKLEEEILRRNIR